MCVDGGGASIDCCVVGGREPRDSFRGCAVGTAPGVIMVFTLAADVSFN